jgi:hypothetical protein
MQRSAAVELALLAACEDEVAEDCPGDGEAVSFAGVLVEVLSPVDGSACGTCTLPCAARYAITGTP